jgi:hypothetical protein
MAVGLVFLSRPSVLEAEAVVDSTGSKGKCDVNIRCLDEVCKIMSVFDKVVRVVEVDLPATFMGISSTWVL